MALAAIIIGAQVFVGAVEHLSTVVGLDPRILALVIAPIATELPEKVNSVLWVRAGKDTLAMGNITGAMVFQSCIPTVLGLVFTDWVFSPESALSFASAGAAFVATFVIFGVMVRRRSAERLAAARRRPDLCSVHRRRAHAAGADRRGPLIPHGSGRERQGVASRRLY